MDINELESKNINDIEVISENVSELKKATPTDDISAAMDDFLENEFLNKNEKEINYTNNYEEKEKSLLEGIDPIEVIINKNDGTKESFLIDGTNKEDQKLTDEIEKNIKSKLDEIKDRIDKDYKNIDSVEIKSGDKYHKKISIKDLVKKELTQVSHNSNGEKMGEEILMNLIKPLNILNNYFNQPTVEKKPELKKNEIPEKSYTIKIDEKEYKFLGYAQDYKKLTVEDETGKKFSLDNNKSFNFVIGPEKNYNSIELELIKKGKTLIQKDEKLPFKIMENENGSIGMKTISHADFSKNLEKKNSNENQNSKSIEKEIKTYKTKTPKLSL